MVTEVVNVLPMLILVGCMGLAVLLIICVSPCIKSEGNRDLFFWFCILGIGFVLSVFLIWYTYDLGWWYVQDCGDMCNVSQLLN